METTSEDSGSLVTAPAEFGRCRVGGVSAAMLEAVFDASPAGLVVLVGQDLVVDHVNAACRAITRPDVDPIGQRFEDIWPHGDPVVVPVLRNVLATGAGLSVEDYPLAAAGGIRRFSVRVRRVPWRRGLAVFLSVWETSDVWEARLAAERAADSALRRAGELDAALDAIADGLILYDRRGEIVRMNETATACSATRPTRPTQISQSGSRRSACTRPTGGSCVWRTRPSRARSGARRSAASTRAWSTRAGRSGSSRAPPPCAAPTTRSWARC
jgi:PAS domain-containing protein